MAGFFVSQADHAFGQACALHDAGRPREAEAILRDLLIADPASLPALTRLADIAIERHDHATAMAHARAALDHEPRCAPALSSLAEGLWLAGQIDRAVQPASLAVDIQPTNPRFRVVLGQILAVLGRAEDAENAVQPVLEQAWHDRVMRARALGVAAEARSNRGAFMAAHAALRQAIELAPDHEPLWMGYGLSLLRLGRLREGWAAYGRRDRIRFFFPDGGTKLPGARWTGQDLAGRTILLKDEQGYGDAIQFFRYIPLLRLAGARDIVLITFPKLQTLFAHSTALARVEYDPAQAGQPDFHCLTGDLPGAFGTELATIPAPIPYLRSPVKVRRRRGGVGLVWSGDPRHLKDHARSIPAEMFLRIADVPNHRFISLQHDVRPEDAAALAARPAIERAGEHQDDFAGTAAIIASLDLVVTVDTSIAHLAGALGKPVWTLLPLEPDWRWLLERSDTPWYPSMRLFRADQGGWDPVIARVAAALRRFKAKQ